jgi:Holliday junction resolvase RusA-like endonuclease
MDEINQVFKLPDHLQLVAHFSFPRVQTWGTRRDQEYKAAIRAAANLTLGSGEKHDWFVFSIRCVVGESRGRYHRQTPDVENIPKLIVDAFTGVLYPDDHIIYVRGVQVEAEFGPDEHEQTEVWIFGFPKKG